MFVRSGWPRAKVRAIEGVTASRDRATSKNIWVATFRDATYSRHVAPTTLKVSEQGRVVIPAQLRRELEIRPGASLVAYIEDERLILEDRDHLAARLQREALAARTTRGSVVDDLIADRRAEAVREEQGQDTSR